MKPKQIIPLQALKRISWDFPDIFPMIDDVVESSDLEMANRWDHKLVYAPVGLAHAAMLEIGEPAAPLLYSLDLALVTALAGWRKAKTVYDFSPVLAEELVKSARSEEMTMPLSTLTLPYWSIYIKPNIKEWDIDGFFVYYDDDLNSKTGKHIKELRFTPLSKNGDALPTIYLMQNEAKEICIKDAIDAILNETNKEDISRSLRVLKMNTVLTPDSMDQAAEELGKLAVQMISFVLYLSAVNADMKRDATLPFKRTKQVRDIAREVEHIHVGDEVAVRIRTMNNHPTARTDSEPLGGHHRSPVTHVRRAHWHTFRVGEGRKKIQVKWLAPVVVNASGEQKNIVTINKINKDDDDVSFF